MNKINHNKCLIAVLFILSLITVFGCSKKSGDRSNKLIIWESYNNSEHKVFEQIVKDYKKELSNKNDSVQVVVERVPFDGLLSKLITAAIANKTPDICRVDIGHVARLAYGGIAQNLDEFGVSDYLKELLPIVGSSNLIAVKDKKSKEVKKNVYGFSDQLSCVALYYNKDMFAEKGLTEPPQSLDQLIEYGKILTDTKKGVYGIGINNSVWWHLPFLYLFNGDVVSKDNKKCVLNNLESEKAISFLKSLYSIHKIEGGAWKAGAINPDQGFINSKYAMIISGPWNINTFKSINYGISIIPSNNGNKSATNIGGTSMVILKNSKQKQKAFEFLKYLTSYKVQKVWSEKTGQISVNKQVNTELAQNQNSKMNVFMNQINYAGARPGIPNYDQLENAVNPIIYSILDNKIDIKTGLNQACEIIENQILNELGK